MTDADMLVERVATAHARWLTKHRGDTAGAARAALAEVAAAAGMLDGRDGEYVIAGIAAHAEQFGASWPSQRKRLEGVAVLLRALAALAEEPRA